MRYKTLVTLAVSALTVLPVTAQAQDKVKISFGGGVTTPNSEVKDHLGNGFNFNFGVEVKVTGPRDRRSLQLQRPGRQEDLRSRERNAGRDTGPH